MTAKLVYLHIPKTAGTSFRGSVWKLYGEDKGMWYGLDTSPLIKKYEPQAAQGKLLLGGHKGIDFYPADSLFLYCSLLRDPVSRVASLFSYYTRPDAASDEAGRSMRARHVETWIQRGIRPDSIVESIEHCKDFRRDINNMQCAYLSRGKRTFDDVLHTINSSNIILGETDNLQGLIDRLAELLDWPELPVKKANVSKGGSHDDILDEPGAVELVKHLCQEDQKLYDYLIDEHAGVFTNVLSKRHIAKHLALSSSSLDKSEELSREAWAKVRLRTQETLPLRPGQAASIDVSLINNSREYLDAGAHRGVCFSYKLIDANGNLIPAEGRRTPLLDSVPPRSSHSQKIFINVPEAHFEETEEIRVTIIQIGKYWVEQFSKNHCSTIRLQKDAR